MAERRRSDAQDDGTTAKKAKGAAKPAGSSGARGRARAEACPVALTIAGSDNSGGAGIQADLKTFARLGCYGTSALTCVVAEHPGRVAGIQAVRADVVRDQIATVFEVFPVRGMKTGMLYSKGVIAAVVAGWDEALRKGKGRLPPLVVDPVMVASSGARLLQTAAVRLMTEQVFPRASLITPNLDEAAWLVGEPLASLAAAREAAFVLQQRYGVPVLVKGGHLELDSAVDVLATETDVRLFRAPFRRGVNTHGTGCTLSAAIAAFLARGCALEEAVRAGKGFVTRSLARAVRVGSFRLLNHQA